MPLVTWIHSATWLLLSLCYSPQQRLLIAPWLLWQLVIDKNTPLAAGELNPAELCGHTAMEGAIMCYWAGLGDAGKLVQ